MKRRVYFRVLPKEEYVRIEDTESEPFEGEQYPPFGKKFTIKQVWVDGALYIDVEAVKEE